MEVYEPVHKNKPLFGTGSAQLHSVTIITRGPVFEKS